MTDIFNRPISHVRLIANVLVAVALAAILFGLVAIVVNDRCSKNVSATDPGKIPVQEIPFK
ncbi:MAG: hypothetical protein NTY23_13895 [Chloroflexi bacterium]|nr:hypothetical protein [Chloroflexota bacterium]